MTQQEDLQQRVQEIANFAKEKEVAILAIQQVTKEGYIETIPMFRDLKVYPKVEAEVVKEEVKDETTG